MDPIEQYRRDDLVFDVTDAGPRDGDVVVLLHGFPAGRSSWDRVAPLLHDAGLRTLAPDQRGYSPGARPRGRAAYTRAALAADVLALVDAAGASRVHLVGHDWGGLVAWHLAALAPERIRSLTVLSTPHPTALGRAIRSSDQGLRSWYMGFFQLPWLPEVLGQATMSRVLQGMGLPFPIAEDYASRMREPGALTAAIDWYRALAVPVLDRIRDGSAPAPTTDGIVRVPTVYLWGERDAALGRRAAELTSEYVDDAYRFVVVDEDHWLPENAPERSADAVLAAIALAG